MSSESRPPDQEHPTPETRPDESDDSGTRSLWGELRERKVVRVAGVYAVVGWGVIVGSSDLLEILPELPSWFPQVVFALVILGFPVAVVLAWAFEVSPDGVRKARARRGATEDRLSRVPLVVGLVVGTLVLATVGWMLWPPDPSETSVLDLDDELVMITTFVSSDETLGYDVFLLMTTRFNGEVGPAATGVHETATLWEQVSSERPTTAKREVAERLGAGLVIHGNAVRGPDGLSLTATLERATSGDVLATHTAIGPADSLNSVVDDLAAGLLGRAGGFHESLDQLTSTSFPAGQAWLAGHFEFGRGEIQAAYDHFVRAVEIDSTFALAAIWVADAGNNVTSAIAEGTARDHLELAWRHRDQLSSRDHAYLVARRGPNYPDPSTRAEREEALRDALDLNPTRSNVWYFLGEDLVHHPPDAEAIDEARRHFDRSLELGPTNPNAILHVLVAALRQKDTEGSIDAADQWAALDSTNALQRLPRFLRAVAQHDTALVVQLYDSVAVFMDFESMELQFMDAPTMLGGTYQAAPLLRTIDRLRRELTPESSGPEYRHAFYAYQALGHPERALDVLADYERTTGIVYHRTRLLSSLYGPLPDEVGAASAAAISDAPYDVDAADPSARLDAARDRTSLELWRLSRGDLSGVDDSVRRQRELQAGMPEAYRKTIETQALLLEAIAQERHGDPGARETLQTMEALFAEGPPGLPSNVYDAMLLAISELYERLGATEDALATLERESAFSAGHLAFNARFARTRGRLAAQLGDTDRAIAEYEFYTRMRAAAAPALQTELEEVRAALEALRG